MKPPPAFPDPLDLRDAGMRGDSRIFRLTHFFRVRTSAGEVIIPTGFETDGASIPRLFWNLLSPFGPWFPAALLHDFLYSRASDRHHRHIDRALADKLFDEAMHNVGVDWFSRALIYRAVRMFGGRSYKRR